MAAGFAQLVHAGDLVLHATDEEFDPPPDEVPPNHHWTGTLIWEPIQPRPAWLDEPGEPWALMTLSSHRQAGEMDLARAAIEAMSNFPVRTLLTLADPHAKDALGIDNERVRVETFVPHSPVLNQAALCVAHAGHGIVAKALYFGVPMVLVPWDRDQPGVAARAEALGVARIVRREDLTPVSLADAIREILETPSYSEQARVHGERIRANDANARACSLIEEFIGR
jgi:UDP:flavonoid glycosyltransferase YjiC (YdhE family)